MHQHYKIAGLYYLLKTQKEYDIPEPCDINTEETYAPGPLLTDARYQRATIYSVPAIDVTPALVDYSKDMTDQKLERTVELFKPAFNPHLEANLMRKSTGKVKFCEAEDRLLAIGIQMYGLNNWDTISEHCLPTKTANQIKYRWKNSTNKHAKTNYLKEFWTKQLAPLTNEEQKLLLDAVEKYGETYKDIAEQVLPARLPSALKKLHRQLKRNNRNKKTK